MDVAAIGAPVTVSLATISSQINPQNGDGSSSQASTPATVSAAPPQTSDNTTVASSSGQDKNGQSAGQQSSASTVHFYSTAKTKVSSGTSDQSDGHATTQKQQQDAAARRAAAQQSTAWQKAQSARQRLEYLVDQVRSAVATGDTERARSLAGQVAGAVTDLQSAAVEMGGSPGTPSVGSLTVEPSGGSASAATASVGGGASPATIAQTVITDTSGQFASSSSPVSDAAAGISQARDAANALASFDPNSVIGLQLSDTVTALRQQIGTAAGVISGLSPSSGTVAASA